MGALGSFSATSPFFLKKLTRKTLSIDYRKLTPRPNLALQFNLFTVFSPSSPFPFSRNRISKGHSFSSYPKASCLNWSLISALAFLECALANLGCQRPARLKVSRRTGAYWALRLLLTAVMISSGTVRTMIINLFNIGSLCSCCEPSVQSSASPPSPSALRPSIASPTNN